VLPRCLCDRYRRYSIDSLDGIDCCGLPDLERAAGHPRTSPLRAVARATSACTPPSPEDEEVPDLVDSRKTMPLFSPHDYSEITLNRLSCVTTTQRVAVLRVGWLEAVLPSTRDKGKVDTRLLNDLTGQHRYDAVFHLRSGCAAMGGQWCAISIEPGDCTRPNAVGNATDLSSRPIPVFLMPVGRLIPDVSPGSQQISTIRLISKTHVSLFVKARAKAMAPIERVLWRTLSEADDARGGSAK
jgi:hypothetical protein